MKSSLSSYCEGNHDENSNNRAKNLPKTMFCRFKCISIPIFHVTTHFLIKYSYFCNDYFHKLIIFFLGFPEDFIEVEYSIWI